MLRYLIRRLLWMPVVLWVLITLSFFLMRAAPGGPFSGERKLPPEIEANLQAKYHLDQPVWRQYLTYLGDLVRGDLGPSYKHKTRTVNEILAQHLPASILLGVVSMLLALMIGLGAGIVAGVKRNSMFDYSAMTLAMVGMSVPAFVVGPMLVLVFAIYLKWFPVTGWGNFPRDLVLPAITLALPFAARIARLTRAGMLEVIHQEYIRTARAKGLSETLVIVRHALKGAMLPVVSFLGPATAQLLTGSLVVEKVFGVPGIGREFVESAFNRDYTLVSGTVILYGVLLISFNLLVDLVYGFLDPRIRYA